MPSDSAIGNDREALLRQACEEFINDAWVPSHLTPEQAVHFVLDHFKRTVLSELKLLDVAVVDEATAHD